ncbi:related to endo-1,3(4)-beta-glucanase [Sporisorium reilianum SRZ2]|uniref:Related to endo-1,3(4)-beta-glucanase n=1 Tax=Sporisorium reilianum (strain SRZ2) TaxID=999809 RepID=E6ZY24_SPORE|nr:related to endo-1,3(4)-beta-glucanase [Sporisorium reilianum SRZ2]
MPLRRVSALTALAVVLLLSSAVLAGNYTLQEEITGRSFLDRFYFWSYADPTHGSVDYVDEFTAVSNGLATVNAAGRFVIRADNTSFVPIGQKRKSVRMHSKRTMGDGVLVGKFSFMPQGCATWPAFWTCTRGNWPMGGEIDVVEGANDQGPRNLASLHTDYGCSIPAGYRSDQSGFSAATNCAYQPGCSGSFVANNSFGPDFNQNGGGYFAVRRETRPGDAGIGVYFWPITTSPSFLPAAVAAIADGVSAPKYVVTNRNATGNDRTELNKWGLPAVFFPNVPASSVSPAAQSAGNASVCQMSKYFDQHEIIINLSLCGDWAGETFGLSGCAAKHGAMTCDDFVRYNPSAFSDARWEIDYVRVYDNAAALSGRPARLLAGTLAVAAAGYLLL